MNKKLIKIYQEIEKNRNSKVLAYVTGDRVNMETQIASDVVDIFGKHLETIGKTKKITLILYTLGGDTMATWNIVNLIREYCDELEIIVPRKARSSGTIMCLGANEIILTHQSTLGPIDPSINSPLGTKVKLNNQEITLPTSVESVKGYFNLAKKELGIKSSKDLIQAFIKLSDTLNPLLIGDVYRRQGQIKMIANKLLDYQNCTKKKKQSIVDFLCSDSGSHDYTISYTEAKQLGLNVSLADDTLNNLVNQWYDIISEELLLKTPYNPLMELAQQNEKSYEYIRVILDSISYGREQFVSKGTLQKIIMQIGVPNIQVNDNRIFEGWEKDVKN